MSGQSTSGDTRVPRLALRLTEAADALGVSHDFFKDEIAPELRIVRRGARVRLVPIKELEAWLDRNAAYAIEAARMRA